MITRTSSVAFAALLLGIVAILIIPLPPFLLDFLLGVNVLTSTLVLLLSVTVEDPLQFSALPRRCLLRRSSGSRWTFRQLG